MIYCDKGSISVEKLLRLFVLRWERIDTEQIISIMESYPSYEMYCSGRNAEIEVA